MTRAIFLEYGGPMMEVLRLSPYLLFNGLGFIVALFSIDQRLGERLAHRRDIAYVLLVLSFVLGWFGAHVLDWVVGFQSFSQAGFTFYGGLIAGLLFFTVGGLRVMRPSELFVAIDLSVIPVLVAHGIGRIGCFFAGCCYGVPIPGTTSRHPTQLYEAAFLFLLAAALLRRRSTRNFRDVTAYLLCYPSFRFFVEFLRDDPRGEALGLSTSQWISLGLLACGAVVLRARHGSQVSPV